MKFFKLKIYLNNRMQMQIYIYYNDFLFFPRSFSFFFFHLLLLFFRSLLNSNMQPNNKFQKLSYRIVSYRETGLKPKKCQKRKEVSFVPMRYYYFVLLFVQTHTHVFYIFIQIEFFFALPLSNSDRTISTLKDIVRNFEIQKVYINKHMFIVLIDYSFVNL